MPRLPPSLFRQAHTISPNLATLLPACRDLPSTKNELRWIREHAKNQARLGPNHEAHDSGSTRAAEVTRQVGKLCRKRGRGMPLQYVLGSQPFGCLDIKCRRGVLIPRAETEAYTLYLSDVLRGSHSRTGSLTVVDFCTGTGCIALTLYAVLRNEFPELQVVGVDISPTAISLANENLRRGVTNGSLERPTVDHGVEFVEADVFDDAFIQDLARQPCDVLISNPPYVSRDVWSCGRGQLGHSVKKYEPKLALVPREDLQAYGRCNHEDLFYARLLDVAALLRPKQILFEIGDDPQALRVSRLAAEHEYTCNSFFELWRDSPDSGTTTDGNVDTLNFSAVDGKEREIAVRGSGSLRSLFIKLQP
jgi:HemK-like putative methylase